MNQTALPFFARNLALVDGAFRDNSTQPNKQVAINSQQKGAMTMNMQLIRQHTHWRIVAASLLILGGMLLAGTRVARVVNNTIDPVAVMSGDGRSVTLTGPLACDQSQTADLRVTLTQRTTGAVATGRIFFPCTPDVQQWQSKSRPKAKTTSNPAPPPRSRSLAPLSAAAKATTPISGSSISRW